MWLPGFKWVGAIHRIAVLMVELKEAVAGWDVQETYVLTLQREIAYRDKLITMQQALIKRDVQLAHVEQLQELNAKAAAYYGVDKIDL